MPLSVEEVRIFLSTRYFFAFFTMLFCHLIAVPHRSAVHDRQAQRRAVQGRGGRGGAGEQAPSRRQARGRAVHGEEDTRARVREDLKVILPQKHRIFHSCYPNPFFRMSLVKPIWLPLFFLQQCSEVVPNSGPRILSFLLIPSLSDSLSLTDSPTHTC